MFQSHAHLQSIKRRVANASEASWFNTSAELLDDFFTSNSFVQHSQAGNSVAPNDHVSVDSDQTLECNIKYRVK